MSVERILENFGVRLVKDVRKSYNTEQKKKASRYSASFNENSRLEGSMKYVIKETSDSVELDFLMNDYWKFVDKGRKKGPVSRQGQKLISDWIKRKGINAQSIIQQMTESKKKPTYAKAVSQLTFLIARKKKYKDTEGTNFYTKIINDGRLEDLKIQLRTEVKKDIIISINGNNSAPNA